MPLPDNATVTVATLGNLPAGAYLVIAKTTVVQTNSKDRDGVARCTVNGDPAINSPTDDYAEAELGRGDKVEGDRATLQTQVTINLASAGAVALRCRWSDNSSADGGAVARETKVTAVRVGTATRTAVTG